MKRAATRDMTQGREWRIILAFALPLMGSNLVNVAYTLADSIIIGNFVSAAAFGAVNACGPLLWVFSSVATGMGSGVSILISQYFGARRHSEINNAVFTVSLFSCGLGLAIVALALAVTRPVLGGLLQVPANLYQDCLTYYVVYSSGMLFQMMYCVFTGVLRALGNARAPLAVLLVAALLNVALDLLLVVVIPMGVLGAAIASLVSQAASGVCALWLMLRVLRSMPQAGGRGQRPRFEAHRLRNMLRLCVPVTLQMVIHAAGFTLLQRFVNGYGTASIEGFAAMGKTEELIHIPVYAFSSALASFTGQNMGAGRVDRAKRACRDTLLMTMGLSLVLGALMLVFDTRILGLYNITGESMLRGKEHLDLMCILLPIFTVTQIGSGTLQGAGDVRITVVSSFTELSSRLLFTWLLGFTAAGFRSIYWSSPPSWVLACLITVVRLAGGKWQKAALLPKTPKTDNTDDKEENHGHQTHQSG